MATQVQNIYWNCLSNKNYSVSKLELQYFFPGVYFVSFDYICHNFCQHQADSDNLFKIITFVIKKNVIKLTLISCVIITGVLLMNQHRILIYFSVLLLDP